VTLYKIDLPNHEKPHYTILDLDSYEVDANGTLHLIETYKYNNYTGRRKFGSIARGYWGIITKQEENIDEKI
jgi:hypothetical protein